MFHIGQLIELKKERVGGPRILAAKPGARAIIKDINYNIINNSIDIVWCNNEFRNSQMNGCYSSSMFKAVEESECSEEFGFFKKDLETAIRNIVIKHSKLQNLFSISSIEINIKKAETKVFPISIKLE